MNVRYPVWLRSAQQRPGASVFATLFALESLARGILSTVITVQALHLLGNTRDVSLLFSTVGMVGIVASFSIPALIRICSRRWIYTAGALLILLASVALATVTIPGQVLGMLARVYGTACLNITLSLYILQYIRRSELTISEPRRLQYSALAWTVGPALGVILYQHLGHAAPYVASGLSSIGVVALFWTFRLRENPTVSPALRNPPRPWPAIRRFVAQPRMRLAWFIVFIRSSWWVFFYIFTAAYAVQHGMGEVAGAVVISVGNAMLFVAPVLGRQAERFGVRATLAAGMLVCGLATLAAGLVQGVAWAVMGLLICGALGAVALDAVGNIPFFAAVRPREREAMTTVFRTYIDASELLPPALYALILTFFPLAGVFLAQGLLMLLAMVWLRHLPARLGRRRIVIRPAEAPPRPPHAAQAPAADVA